MSRTEKRKQALKSVLENTYRSYPKKEYTEVDIKKKFKMYFKLLNKLPNMIKPYFEELTSELLNAYINNKSYDNMYAIVWLGEKVQHIYCGKLYKSYLPSNWEDEIDFCDCCYTMLDISIKFPNS